MARRYNNNVIYVDDNRARDFIDPILMGFNNYIDGLSYAKRLQNDDRARTQADLNAMNSLDPDSAAGSGLLNAAKSIADGKYDTKGIFGLGNRQGADPYNLMGVQQQQPVPFVNGEITPDSGLGWSQAIAEKYGLPTSNYTQQPAFIPQQQKKITSNIPVFRTEQFEQVTPAYTIKGNGNVSYSSFKNALMGQESGGNYTAQNGRTGAFGAYQIMPENWPSWATRAGLSANAPQTPENQELVVDTVLGDYYNRLGPRDAAKAWYAGEGSLGWSDAAHNRKQGNGDEPSINEYADSVLQKAGGIAGQDQYVPEKTTVTTKKMLEFAGVDMTGLPDRTKTYQDAKKAFLQERLSQLNDKNLSTAEKNAIARGRKEDVEQFDKRFEESWQTKANEAMNDLDERLSSYLYSEDRPTALAAARLSDSTAKRFKIDRPSMTDFIKELNPGEKLQPFDDGATSGFMAYNPMTGETRIVSSMDKKLSPSQILSQSNTDRAFYADQDYKEKSLRMQQENALEAQKTKRMQQIINALKLMYTKDAMGNTVPLPGKENDIKALQQEYLSLNGIDLSTAGTGNSGIQVDEQGNVVTGYTPISPVGKTQEQVNHGVFVQKVSDQAIADIKRGANPEQVRANLAQYLVQSGMDPTASLAEFDRKLRMRYGENVSDDPTLGFSR